MVHVLVEHVIPNRTISSRGRSRCIICRSSRTTKSIRSKSLTLSIEPPVTDVNVLVEQCTTWSEEAVLGHTYSFISCANMKCLAFSSFSCAKTIESVYTGGWGNRWLQLVELEKFRLAEKVVGSLFMVTHGKEEVCILFGRRGRI